MFSYLALERNGPECIGQHVDSFCVCLHLLLLVFYLDLADTLIIHGSNMVASGLNTLHL